MIEDVKNGSCYFCPKPINGKAVEWVEITNYQNDPEAKYSHRLLLHPKCAVRLGERLVGDAFQADPEVDRPELVQELIDSRIDYARHKANEKEEDSS